MTITEIEIFVGMGVQAIGLAIVIAKLVWGSATSHHEGLALVRSELVLKMEGVVTNIGNVTANIGGRIHQLELAAMETRAVAAETYMRRDNYYKAAEEFKRDVKVAHDDLKQQMHAGFDDLKEQINAVSMSIEENRRVDRR